MNNKLKEFRVEDGTGSNVLGGDVSIDNTYISVYGFVVDGKNPHDLLVGETCVKEYNLSGQKKTRYYIVRTK